MSWRFELIAGPYEGPAGGLAWDGAAMLFSLVDEGRILRFHPAAGDITEFRRYTNRVNGIAFGSDDALYGCQEAGRRIVRFEADGSMRPTANQLDGAFHNHPCDLAVDSLERVWFSDPYHAKAAPGPRFFPPLDHASVLRLERDEKRAWILTRMTYDTNAPRAVLLSPDEATLYVAEGEVGRKGARELRAYPIRADGTLGPYSALHAFGADHRGEQRGIEGLCLDSEGNVIACGGWARNGTGPLVYVFSPSGRILETHPFPDDLPARCAFGDDDLHSLYVTTLGGCVYRAQGITRQGWRRGTPLHEPRERLQSVHHTIKHLNGERVMAEALKPIRRVVTGNDERGRSRIVWDGPAPNAHPNPNGPSGHTDLWVWHRTPPPLDGEDAGLLHYDFPSSPEGGHVRVIEAKGRPADYDPARDPLRIEPHPPKGRPTGRAWDRGGKSLWSSDMHKTQTIDYAVCIEGMRLLVLDDAEVELKAGDVVLQVGAWHQWKQPRAGRMVFDMFSADFPDGPAGVAQGNDPVMRPQPDQKLPPGVKPTRRVVTIDRKAGEGNLVSDNASPDVRTDPARPGFACARMWVTDSTPAKIVYETLHLPNVLQPPKRGSVFNVFTFPPDESWKGRVGRAEVEAFYGSMGARGASTHSPLAPHPYMQKISTLDFCVVIEGEIVLVLDTGEAALRAGDVVVQRGTNHAWSNRSGKPAVVAIASHDAG